MTHYPHPELSPCTHARLGGSQAGWDGRHKGKRALAQAEAVKEGRQAHCPQHVLVLRGSVQT